MSPQNKLFNFSWKNLTPNPDISINVHYSSMCSDKNRFQPHYHSYYCGFYVTEGEYVVRFEKETVRIGQHQCMLIRPENIHYVDEGTNAKGYALAVNQDLLMHTFLLHMAHNRIYSDFFYQQFIGTNQTQPFIHIQDNTPTITTAILQRLEYELNVNDSLTKDLAEIGFITFLAQLSRNVSDQMPLTATTTAPSLQTILSYIEERSASATLQSTAEYFHYNASYLSRFLSKETGKTFRDWQKQYRMEKAITLLESTEYSIENIAQLIGYSNSSYFYQAFQTHYQMTPSQYRKQYLDAHAHTKIVSKHTANSNIN